MGVKFSLWPLGGGLGVVGRKGRPEHGYLSAGGVFSERRQAGGSEENPQAQRARDGEQAVPEGSISCEGSDPCGLPDRQQVD